MSRITPLTPDEVAELEAELAAQGLPMHPEGEAFWQRMATLTAPCFEQRGGERQAS